MRKNKMMRLASGLLVAVLLTTCVISGTFAKYISETEVTDGARVAKWGWGDTKIELDLFDKAYTNVEAATVDGAQDKVVAPGTKNTYEVKFDPASGFKPEVAYKLTFDVTAVCDPGLEEELNWTLKVGDTTKPYETIDELAAAIKALSVPEVAPNTANPIAFTIGWEWPFETGTDVTGGMTDEVQGDASDVVLGNAAQLDKCSITINLTATQLD